MHIPDRLDTAPAHQTGTEVLVIEENGDFTARGRIEESDAIRGTHKIRNEKGHLISAKSSRTFSVQEAEAMVESWKDVPDYPNAESSETEYEPNKMIETVKKVFVWVGVAGIVLSAVFIPFAYPKPEAPTNTGSVAPRSEVEVLTEELNALNLRRAPLIESCGQLKATEKEIKLRTDRLSEIRNK